MGVVNVTPDSFSGDGLADRPKEALDLALRLEADGADLIDIGAESSRPGSSPISVEEELQRLLPPLELICSRVKIPLSVDTCKSEVARSALEAGAAMINDVWGLKADPEVARVVAEHKVPLVVMHCQENREYQDLVPEVMGSLERSIKTALDAGISTENIIIDPGIGFAKTADHNLEILRRLGEFTALGYPILLGTSRKSTIGLILDLSVDQRLEGTAATVALAIAGGADMVRVHDVAQMVRVVRMSDAIVRGWRPSGWAV